MTRSLVRPLLIAVILVACETPPVAPTRDVEPPRVLMQNTSIGCTGCGLEHVTVAITLQELSLGNEPGDPTNIVIGQFSCESAQRPTRWTGVAISDDDPVHQGSLNGRMFMAADPGAPDGPLSVQGQLQLPDGTVRVGLFVTQWDPGARSCTIVNNVMRITINTTAGFAVSGVDADGNNVSGGGPAFLNGYVEIAPDMSVIASGFTMRLLSSNDPELITIAPEQATHDVGTTHTLVTTVRKYGNGGPGSGDPLPGARVAIAVSGGINNTFQCITDAAGQCSVTYRGPDFRSRDNINAFVDINGDGSPGLGEPSATATVAWGVPAPTAVFNTPASVAEGTTVTLSFTGASAAAVRYAFDCGDGYGPAGQASQGTCSARDNGTLLVKGRVIDGNEDDVFTEYTGEIVVQNVAPTATLANNGPVVEGSPILLQLSNSHDVAADAAAGFTYAFDCGPGYSVPGASSSATCATQDNASRAVRAKILDKDGGVSEYAATVVVGNASPVLTAITLPAGPVPVNTPVTFGATFKDAGTADVHTAIFDLDLGGPVAAGTVVETQGSGSATATVSYLTPGVYTIEATITDDDGGIGTRSSALDVPAYLVVYEAGSGFVTGGGWIWSPAGAYLPDPTLTGKATFGFVAKYQKGANAPSGNTEFQFRAGELDFRATSYDWLVVAGNSAKYKGEGTVNGRSGYGFMLTAFDRTVSGEPDGFRIKIWDLATRAVLYDNKAGESEDSDKTTPLGGGSIVIHK